MCEKKVLEGKIQHLFGDKYPLPTRKLPKWLVWLMAPTAGMTRKEASNNIDHPWRADHSKAENELGVTFRPVAPAMKRCFSS